VASPTLLPSIKLSNFSEEITLTAQEEPLKRAFSIIPFVILSFRLISSPQSGLLPALLAFASANFPLCLGFL